MGVPALMATAFHTLLRRLAVAASLLLAACGSWDPGFDQGRVPVSGLRPIAPPLGPEPLFGRFPPPEQHGLAMPVIDSRQPTLHWEPAPGVHLAYDQLQPPPRVPFLQMPAEELAGVTYDLQIWPVRSAGGVPVYRRDALPGTTHRIETALDPATDYCWSVRARFRRDDGRPAVSEWSLAMWPPLPDRLRSTDQRRIARDVGFVPSSYCYRFRTPPA
jgi:hypothetical protein